MKLAPGIFVLNMNASGETGNIAVFSTLLIFLTNFPDAVSNHQDNISVLCIPLSSHFYIVKVGFTGVFIIFALKHRL